MVAKASSATGAGALAPGEPQLHAQLRGAGDVDVLLLHGLFGAGGNLGAIARALAAAGFRVHQLDLPNHGRSPRLEEPSIPRMARAVRAYADAAAAGPPVLLGHSLGGKVAMQFALEAPASVAALVVADIAPRRYAPGHAAVFAAIDAVVAGRPATRRAAAGLMRRHLEDEAVVQFLSLSLCRGEAGQWHWRFDAAGLRAAYPALLAAPDATGVYRGPVLLLRGEHSRYVDDAGLRAARGYFSHLRCVSIAQAGHWLHAEQPEAVIAAVLCFLESAGSLSGHAGVPA